MKNSSGKELIKDLFKNVLQNQSVDIEIIKKYISEKYIQYVDGKELRFEQFVEHIKKQKEVIESIKVDFISMVEENNIVFTNHIVSINKKDNSFVKVKVIAEFIIENEKLVKCDELTFLLNGSSEDKDLGSRH
ncbi:hypothetical protein [Aliarcobacter butzleri]|uniref:hypothetical protein n=1 Tax=Aliarcobacter butzleri TaxID=28197 RepID=UPI001EDE5221|nr:hypothetical protein [Aliarcobacter butzleri]MCG3679893.1 hypothetical protein [Aliarcobacter butzleri]MCP3648936.1 hypothetical protein [Arcobacter sp. DNRA7]MCR1815110.1 hypothetical protein [Aliarcobacter butzleri]